MKVENGLVQEARFCFGGMAATPKRSLSVEQAIQGKPLTQELFDQAASQIDLDFQPLSDFRGSANYRSLVAKGLVKRFLVDYLQLAKTGVMACEF